MLARKARAFVHLPAFTQGWFIPLWLLLGLSKALIRVASFKRVAGHLGQPVGLAACVPFASDAQQQRARQIGRAVQLAARYTPWESNCFPQAVAARLLLGLYGIPYALYFGLKREVGCLGMKAHAWVAAGRVHVTGGPGCDQYAVVGVFVSHASAAA